MIGHVATPVLGEAAAKGSSRIQDQPAMVRFCFKTKRKTKGERETGNSISCFLKNLNIVIYSS